MNHQRLLHPHVVQLKAGCGGRACCQASCSHKASAGQLAGCAAGRPDGLPSLRAAALFKVELGVGCAVAWFCAEPPCWASAVPPTACAWRPPVVPQEVFAAKPFLALVMEFVPNGDMFQVGGWAGAQRPSPAGGQPLAGPHLAPQAGAGTCAPPAVLAGLQVASPAALCTSMAAHTQACCRVAPPESPPTPPAHTYTIYPPPPPTPQYVVSRRGLPESEARWFFQQLMLGMDYCHRKGVMSRDIKLENTLLVLQPDKKPLLKVGRGGQGSWVVPGGAAFVAGCGDRRATWIEAASQAGQAGSAVGEQPGMKRAGGLSCVLHLTHHTAGHGELAGSTLPPSPASPPLVYPAPQLCDFGYSKHDTLDSVAKSKVGTPGYTAPGEAVGAGGVRCVGVQGAGMRSWGRSTGRPAAAPGLHRDATLAALCCWRASGRPCSSLVPRVRGRCGLVPALFRGHPECAGVRRQDGRHLVGR